MALNTVVAGRAWLYSHNVGRNAQSGMGFSTPVSAAITSNGTLYVANRSGEQNPSMRVTKCTIDHEFIDEFGRSGPVYGGSNNTSLFTWITGIALDSNENVYTSDEWRCLIHVFDSDGNYLSTWGEKGDNEGQLNGSAGICFDADENLWIVNSFNSRIQKFTKDGQFLDKWGHEGSGDGEFNMPWGIDIDSNCLLYTSPSPRDRG